MQTSDNTNLDVGGILAAGFMILIGGLAIWDTLDMTDSDSYVFPRAVVIAMITLSLIYILRQLLRPGIGSNDEAGMAGGSNPRRVGLVASMIGGSLLMPWVGFLPSGLLVFGCIMWLAMYDEWTPKLRWLFPLVGVVIVVGFYLLFAILLSVPLPTDLLFD